MVISPCTHLSEKIVFWGYFHEDAIGYGGLEDKQHRVEDGEFACPIKPWPECIALDLILAIEARILERDCERGFEITKLRANMTRSG